MTDPRSVNSEGESGLFKSKQGHLVLPTPRSVLVLFPVPKMGNLSPSEGRNERRSDLLFYSIMPVSRETNYGALLY